MTATTPPAGQPAVRPRPTDADAATGVGGAVLLVGTRVALWLGVQLLLAGKLVLGGTAASGRPWLASAIVVAVWAALYYALGRRLLPIMAARWVINGGTALGLALGLAGRAGHRSKPRQGPRRAAGCPWRSARGTGAELERGLSRAVH
jgi:hypothetical protein